jgi:hypothetical protein
LEIISIAIEDINTLAIKIVSADHGAIDMYWEINIQGYYLHEQNIYCIVQKVSTILFVNCVGVPHRTKGRCGIIAKQKRQ